MMMVVVWTESSCRLVQPSLTLISLLPPRWPPPMSLSDSLLSQCYLMGNIPVLHVMTYQTL